MKVAFEDDATDRNLGFKLQEEALDDDIYLNLLFGLRIRLHGRLESLMPYVFSAFHHKLESEFEK